MSVNRACLTCCRYPQSLDGVDPDNMELLDCPTPKHCPYPYQEEGREIIEVEDLPW